MPLGHATKVPAVKLVSDVVWEAGAGIVVAGVGGDRDRLLGDRDAHRRWVDDGVTGVWLESSAEPRCRLGIQAGVRCDAVGRRWRPDHPGLLDVVAFCLSRFCVGSPVIEQRAAVAGVEATDDRRVNDEFGEPVRDHSGEHTGVRMPHDDQWLCNGLHRPFDVGDMICQPNASDVVASGAWFESLQRERRRSAT